MRRLLKMYPLTTGYTVLCVVSLIVQHQLF